MQDVGAGIMASNLMQTAYGEEPQPMGSRSLSGNPMADIFPTKEGALLLMPAIDAQSVKVWPVLGRPELATDPRFDTLAARLENDAECVAVITEALASADAETWEARFGEVGVPAAAVSSLPRVLEDAQLAHRGTLRTVPAPALDGREILYTDTPFKITDEPTGADHPPPTVGADTDAVLGEAGYTANEIAGLREAGVV